MTLFPLTLVALLVGVTYWLDRSTAEAEREKRAARHEADYIVEKFEIKRFDSSGGLKSTVAADVMTHYADDDSTDMRSPRVSIISGDRHSVIIADKAHMIKRDQEITMTENVSLASRAGEANPMTLQTEKLIAYPDEDRARIPGPLTVIHDNSRLHAGQGEYQGKTGVTHLSGRVSATFNKVP